MDKETIISYISGYAVTSKLTGAGMLEITVPKKMWCKILINFISKATLDYVYCTIVSIYLYIYGDNSTALSTFYASL